MKLVEEIFYTFSVAHSIIIENKKCAVLLDTVLRVGHISEVFVRKWPQQQQGLYHRQLMSASSAVYGCTCLGYLG